MSRALGSSPMLSLNPAGFRGPVASGKVSGPSLPRDNTGGFAHPPIYNNGTLQVPVIDLHGATDDGEAFNIHEVGLGSTAAQVTALRL
jgi:hypothetical protein